MLVSPNAPGTSPGAFCVFGRGWGRMIAGLLLLSWIGCTRVPEADVVLHNTSEPETIDPHILTGQPDGRIAAALFEGLTRFDPQTGRGIPGLAERWDISPDAKTYTFHLRPGLTFSTGEPITADDVVWSWNRAVAPETAADYVNFYFYVVNGKAIANSTNTPAQRPPLGIRALDARTVEVRLVNPTPFFLDLCAMRIMAVVPRFAIERDGDQWVRHDPIPCSGPYQLVRWRPNAGIRLKRNPRYWDVENVRSETIDVLSGDSPSAALNLFLTGRIDFLVDKTVLPPELADTLKQRPEFHPFNYLGNYFVRFNCTRKPLDDARVRRAMSLVIDKRRLVERITRMGERPADALVPPGTDGYDGARGLGRNALDARTPQAFEAAMATNIVEAQRLLAEAGFPGGRGFPRLSYMFNAGGGGGARMHEQMGVEMQAMFRKHLGIEIDMRPMEYKTYLTDMSHLNYDLIRSSWVGDYNDPTTFLDLFLSDSGNNRTGWKNARYDSLIEHAASTRDPAERFQLLREAETLLVRDEAPILPLHYYVGMFAYDPEILGGVYPNMTDEHPFSAIYRKKKRGGTKSP